MTPNYVSNSSTEVSQWCTCEGSGNDWQGCQRILHMFSNNICLREYKFVGFWDSTALEPQTNAVKSLKFLQK